MNDPKLESAPIVRATNCCVGCHVFTWVTVSKATYGSRDVVAPHDTTLKCSCATYTWAQWQEVIQPKADVKEKT